MKGTGGALAAAPLFVPATAFGANDRLAYGVIGAGGRWLNKAFQELGAQCVALCDVYQPNIEEAKKDSPAGAKGYVDYHDLLAQPGLDFVVIGTPDHQHRPNLLAALAAGKDVYQEKPLSLSLEESGQMIQAVRRTKQIVQIGMQRRSMPFIHRAKSLIDDGMLGKISMVKAKWNWNFDLPLDNSPLPGALDWERFVGPAKKRPLEPMRFRWWRAFWDYSGGNMTDQGTHLMDVVQWMTQSGPPLSAMCSGKVIDAPGAEVPNVFTATFEYPQFLATWTLDYRTSFEYDWSIQFIGDRGAMTLDRTGCRVYNDAGSSPTPWAAKELPELVYKEADRDSALLHMRNLLECIRSRKEPNCPIEVAAAAVAGPHMANLAYREDRKVKRGGAS
ncbi:MAG: Gfo/Idh/MocA family oxidoreductase [Bryobacteraceae bacterium]|nr:Gfo/Idh/MocA family oxidoreductase [Bryobacteraceae bacterium]